jgi:catechol 2,3-dioxygenase-like lactoylglutathione lyase family enzyme
MAKHTRLGFCILYTPDVSAKVAFYERAFGMERKFVAEGESYAEMKGPPPLGFASEAQAGALAGEFARSRRDAPPAACEIGFIVDDVAAAYARAVEAGAIALHAPEQKPWGQTVAYVRDCDGALVEICTAWD